MKKEGVSGEHCGGKINLLRFMVERDRSYISDNYFQFLMAPREIIYDFENRNFSLYVKYIVSLLYVCGERMKDFCSPSVSHNNGAMLEFHKIFSFSRLSFIIIKYIFILFMI